MKTKYKRMVNEKAFTLLELLVVIGIISLLIGLLVPGMGKVKKISWDLKQKSEFHGMEISLEFFNKDFGKYPDSDSNYSDPAKIICGAHHLAEALVGRDLKGFDPKTDWYAPGLLLSGNPDDVYNSDEDSDSMKRRKEPYFELRDTNAYVLNELYNSNTAVGDSGNFVFSDEGDIRAPVLTDIFTHTSVTLSNNQRVRVGSPIVYFKANTSSKNFRDSTAYTKWIYNYDDNKAIFGLGTVRDKTVKHHFDIKYTYTDLDSGTEKDGQYLFYKTITNPNISVYMKPFNAKKFILMSAGWDGIFGTKDDVNNFDY